MIVPTIPTITLKGIDKPINTIRSHMATNLTWLDYTYGVAKRHIIKDTDNKEITAPVVYYGNNNYWDLFPKTKEGNILWFDVDNSQDIIMNKSFSKFDVDFGAIFWFDVRDIIGNNEYMNIELIKSYILAEFRAVALTNGHFTITGVEEDIDDIYRGYTFTEIKSQVRMYPYYALRFNGNLKFTEKC